MIIHLLIVIITMSKVNKITNSKSFKKENLNNWKDVSKFWLSTNLSQKKDLIKFYKSKISDLIHQRKQIKILDIGCGDGWILEILESIKNIDYLYMGIDYNKTFISHLNKNLKKPNTSFVFCDIERADEYIKLGKFDLIINSFSLFEMPNYKNALKNEMNMINENGSILIFSIDPISQLMAISENEKEFKENCHNYALFKNKGYYRKLIDTGEGFASQEYLGILHSISDYFKIFKKYDFLLHDLDEINLLNDVVPKIYQYARFTK